MLQAASFIATQIATLGEALKATVLVSLISSDFLGMNLRPGG